MAEGEPINTICYYCGRWATHPLIENPDHLNVIWKTVEEMNGVEKEELKEVLAHKERISHGICCFCLSVIKELGYFEAGNLKKIREMSLAKK